MTEPDGPAAASTGPEGSAALSADPAAAAVADRTRGADLTERVVDSKVIHRGRYLEFRVDTVERSDGSRAEREVVGHPGAVAILAIDEADRVLLVRQFRLPAGRVLLEVPAGTLDVDPATGAVEDPDGAARRELEEETGYRAGSWRRLASFWTAPGFASELMHLYLATDLRPAHEDGRLGPDEDERLELDRLPFAEAVAAAERGDIADAKSLVALLWLDRLTLAEPRVAPVTGAGLPAGPSIVLTFQPQLSETVEASMVASRRSVGARVVGVFGILLGILGLATGTPIAGGFLLVLGVLIEAGLLVVPIVVISARRRPDLTLPPTTATFDPVGIDYVTPRGRSTLRWEAFRRIRESGQFFFLETGLTVIYVPKRAFDADQLAAFRRLLAEAGFGPDGRRAAARPAPPPG